MSTQTVTLFGTLLVIFSTCFHSTAGLEGRLFYLSFMNISVNSPDLQPGFQEIFVSSSASGKVKIRYHSPYNYTETIIELNTANSFQYIKRIDLDLASPLNSLVNLAIVVSSEMDISVQTNKAEASNGEGYLALPITEQSLSFFLVSYTLGWASTFSIASPINDTRISISYVRGNSSDSLMNLTMQANDVYQGGSPAFDYTGVYVASSQPIAVFSGHSCTYVPVRSGYCDSLVEQVPPVAQWGRLFIMASFYGRPWGVGYRIRVVAQGATNVAYTFQSFDANNNPSTWSIFRRVTLVRGQWDEASLENITVTNAVVVMVNCTFDCFVMQYNPGFAVLNSSGPGETSQPDPFMITVPPLNHYPQNVRFSTSRNYNGNGTVYECLNGINIVAKTDDVNLRKIHLDGIPLTSIGGTTFVINADGYSDYSVIIAPLAPGFHSVTSNDPDAYYAVFVYGFGIYSMTGYGYLGGYRYLPMTVFPTNPRSPSTLDPIWPPSATPVTSTPERWVKASEVNKLGIALGVSCGVIIFVLVGIVICLCVKNRSLSQYTKEIQKQSQNGRPNHSATNTAAVQSSSSSSAHYETPLTEIPYREYEKIASYNRIISAETESTHRYDNPLH